jgi:hypothetical protein
LISGQAALSAHGHEDMNTAGGICELAGMDCLVLAGLHPHLRSANGTQHDPVDDEHQPYGPGRLGAFCSGSLNPLSSEAYGDRRWNRALDLHIVTDAAGDSLLICEVC